MTRHRVILFLSSAIALAGCGPATAEGKVRARAAVDFNCSEGEIVAKPLADPNRPKFAASGCGQEAVYVNAPLPGGGGDNWVLDSPNR
jgi:hypothetical protein